MLGRNGDLLWLWKKWPQGESLNSKWQEKVGQPSDSSDAPKKINFYFLRSRHEQEISPDVVTGMLKIFTLDVYDLLDPGATFSFVTPLVAKMFDTLPDILHEPFLEYTPVGESVVFKRVYQNCPIALSNRVSYVDLVELDILDFDILLCMDWLHACFASIDCRTRVVRFNLPNEPVVDWKGKNSIPRGRIISYLKTCKMISNGCLYHIVSVQELDFEIPPTEPVPVMSEFPEVFHMNFPVFLPNGKLILLSICSGNKFHFNPSISDGSGQN